MPGHPSRLDGQGEPAGRDGGSLGDDGSPAPVRQEHDNFPSGLSPNNQDTAPPHTDRIYADISPQHGGQPRHKPKYDGLPMPKLPTNGRWMGTKFIPGALRGETNPPGWMKPVEVAWSLRNGGLGPPRGEMVPSSAGYKSVQRKRVEKADNSPSYNTANVGAVGNQPSYHTTNPGAVDNRPSLRVANTTAVGNPSFNTNISAVGMRPSPQSTSTAAVGIPSYNTTSSAAVGNRQSLYPASTTAFGNLPPYGTTHATAVNHPSLVDNDGDAAKGRPTLADFATGRIIEATRVAQMNAAGSNIQQSSVPDNDVAIPRRGQTLAGNDQQKSNAPGTYIATPRLGQNLAGLNAFVAAQHGINPDGKVPDLSTADPRPAQNTTGHDMYIPPAQRGIMCGNQFVPFPNLPPVSPDDPRLRALEKDASYDKTRLPGQGGSPYGGFPHLNPADTRFGRNATGLSLTRPPTRRGDNQFGKFPDNAADSRLGQNNTSLDKYLPPALRGNGQSGGLSGLNNAGPRLGRSDTDRLPSILEGSQDGDSRLGQHDTGLGEFVPPAQGGNNQHANPEAPLGQIGTGNLASLLESRYGDFSSTGTAKSRLGQNNTGVNDSPFGLRSNTQYGIVPDTEPADSRLDQNETGFDKYPDPAQHGTEQGDKNLDVDDSDTRLGQNDIGRGRTLNLPRLRPGGMQTGRPVQIDPRTNLRVSRARSPDYATAAQKPMGPSPPAMRHPTMGAMVRRVTESPRRPSLRHTRFPPDFVRSVTAQRSEALNDDPFVSTQSEALNDGPFVSTHPEVPKDDPFVSTQSDGKAVAREYKLDASKFTSLGESIVRRRQHSPSPDYKARRRDAAASHAQDKCDTDIEDDDNVSPVKLSPVKLPPIESARGMLSAAKFSPTKYRAALRSITQMSPAQRKAAHTSSQILGVTPGGSLFGPPLVGCTEYGAEPTLGNRSATAGGLLKKELPSLFGDINTLPQRMAELHAATESPVNAINPGGDDFRGSDTYFTPLLSKYGSLDDSRDARSLVRSTARNAGSSTGELNIPKVRKTNAARGRDANDSATRDIYTLGNTSTPPDVKIRSPTSRADLGSGLACALQSASNRSLRRNEVDNLDHANDAPAQKTKYSNSRSDLVAKALESASGRTLRQKDSTLATARQNLSNRSMRLHDGTLVALNDGNIDDADYSPALKFKNSNSRVDLGTALVRARHNASNRTMRQNDGELDDGDYSPALKVKNSTSRADLNSALARARHSASNRTLKQKGSFDPRMVKMNPQEVYHPEACVFVGNLAIKRSDLELEAELTRVLSQFGTVYVSIHRDEGKGNIPHAFCQFTKIDHANQAMKGAPGTMVFGRPLRCERAKASRWFVIHRRDRGPIGIEEAREVMQVYGEIAHCSPLGEQLCVSMGLPYACQVAFADFDLGRASKIKQQNQAHRGYHIDLLGGKPKLSADDKAREFMKGYDQTRRTLYVSNLPEFADEQNLTEHFSRFGIVENIKICLGSQRSQVARRGRSNQSRFAFVEFLDFTHVQEALDNSPHYDFFGVTLRTEPKIFKTAGSATTLVRRIESSKFDAPVGEEGGSGQGPRRTPAAMEPIEGSVASGGHVPSDYDHLSPRATLAAAEANRLGGVVAVGEAGPGTVVADGAISAAPSPMAGNHGAMPGTPFLPLGGFGYWPGIQPMTTPGGALSWGVNLAAPLAGGLSPFLPGAQPEEEDASPNPNPGLS